MKNSLKLLLLGSVFILSSISQATAAEVELDRVAVVVNSGVVLKSEIEDLIHSITVQAKKKNQTLPSDRALRTQVTEKLINDAIIMQLGERMGVQISDAQLDETLTNMARESNLSLEQFRKTLVDESVNYEKYRENVRKELISGEVRRSSVRRRIYISPQEIAIIKQVKEDLEHKGFMFLNIEKDSLEIKTIQNQINEIISKIYLLDHTKGNLEKEFAISLEENPKITDKIQQKITICIYKHRNYMNELSDLKENLMLIFAFL